MAPPQLTTVPRKPSFWKLVYFTTLFALRYWTVGSWVRIKWHYLRWRGRKYYL